MLAPRNECENTFEANDTVHEQKKSQTGLDAWRRELEGRRGWAPAPGPARSSFRQPPKPEGGLHAQKEPAGILGWASRDGHPGVGTRGNIQGPRGGEFSPNTLLIPSPPAVTLVTWPCPLLFGEPVLVNNY